MVIDHIKDEKTMKTQKGFFVKFITDHYIEFNCYKKNHKTTILVHFDFDILLHIYFNSWVAEPQWDELKSIPSNIER